MTVEVRVNFYMFVLFSLKLYFILFPSGSDEILVIGIHPLLNNSQSVCAFTWRDRHILVRVGGKATYRVPCSYF